MGRADAAPCREGKVEMRPKPTLGFSWVAAVGGTDTAKPGLHDGGVGVVESVGVKRGLRRRRA
jgi:hypothetical protein